MQRALSTIRCRGQGHLPPPVVQSHWTRPRTKKDVSQGAPIWPLDQLPVTRSFWLSRVELSGWGPAWTFSSRSLWGAGLTCSYPIQPQCYSQHFHRNQEPPDPFVRAPELLGINSPMNIGHFLGPDELVWDCQKGFIPMKFCKVEGFCP